MEQPLVFPGNDLVGVMLPDAVRRLVNGFSIKPAERAVVLTVDDRGLQAAADLEAAGVEIARVVDFRTDGSPSIEAQGKGGKVAQVAIGGHHVKADLVVMSGSPQPNYKLLAQAGARVAYDESRGIFVPTDLPAHVEAVGAVTGRRRRAGGAERHPRPPGRQVLRLHLRGPDDQGSEVRDRGGLRFDRAVEALYDRDDGTVSGEALPHQLDPRLREDDRARREHDRHDHVPAALHADLDGAARRPTTGAPEADVSPSSPQGHGRDDDVDGGVATPALVRPRPRRRGPARAPCARPDRRLDPRQDRRHRP